MPEFTLEVLQTPTFNVKMSVNGASTEVQVSAAGPILNTENATLGTTFTANTISNFPLNGQDFSALTAYLPGLVSTNETSGMTNTGRNVSYVDSPNINGNRAQANNYTLDGNVPTSRWARAGVPAVLGSVRVLIGRNSGWKGGSFGCRPFL